MSRLTLPGLLLLPLLAAGCIGDEPKTTTVADNPFGRMLPSPEAGPEAANRRKRTPLASPKPKMIANSKAMMGKRRMERV